MTWQARRLDGNFEGMLWDFEFEWRRIWILGFVWDSRSLLHVLDLSESMTINEITINEIFKNDPYLLFIVFIFWNLFWKHMIYSTEPFYDIFYKSIKQFYGCWLNLLNIFEILTLSFVNKARPIVSAKPRMKMENKMKFLSQFLWIKFVLRTKLTALRN